MLEDKKNSIIPTTSSEWRLLVLNWVLKGMLVFWLLGLIWNLISNYFGLPFAHTAPITAVLIAVYLISIAILFLITLNKNLRYTIRVNMLLFLLLVVGLVNLLLHGLMGAGSLYLLAFVALVAIFYDLRRSTHALIFSVVVISLTVAWHMTMNPRSQNGIAVQDIIATLNGGVIFIVSGALILFSITYLIRSLENSLTQAQKERDLATVILEKSGTLVVLYEPDGKILRFNQASEIISGYRSEELVGGYIWDHLLTEEGTNLIKTAFTQLSTDLQPVSFEGYWVSKDGQRALIAWHCAPLVNQSGQIELIISTGIDVTSFKETEADRGRLLESEHEQRLLAEALAEITLSLTSYIRPEDVLDNILLQAQRIVPFKAANIALIEGDTVRAARWQGYEEFGNDEYLSNLVQPLSTLPLDREMIATRKPYVVRDTRHESRWRLFEDTAWIRSHLCVPIIQQEEVIGLLRMDGDQPDEFSEDDASQLQNLANTVAIALANSQLIQETRQKARQVQRILNTVHDGILLLDDEYVVELANSAAMTFLPTLTDAPENEPIKLFGGQPIRDIVMPPTDGSLWHEINLKQPPMIFEAAAQPIEAGGWVLVIRDITESRKQQQYVQAQERLAMVGQMAAGIAHDFNNIMTVIILYTQMLLKAPDISETVFQRLNTVFDQSKLASNLISQILDFSRQSDMKRRQIYMLPFLKELTKMLQRTLPENIDIHLDFDEGDYIISADLTRMQQVVMNLVVNARDAMPKGGDLCLDLSQITINQGETPPVPDMAAGEWVKLKVIDAGTGIPEENIQHIFEPLFTTKERGQGTGLGLAQVHGIVKQHDGFVDVDSVMGEGTTFTIYLPVQRMGDTASADSEQMELVGGHGEKILVVEDDEITRKAICAILETFNYETMEAVDANEAIRLFDFFSDEISLVLSDMVMPGMNGDELLTCLQEKQPDIEMIIITGYPFAERDKMTLSQGIVDWLQKPFEVEELVKALQLALPFNEES
ncbi:MAG: hypothetical protein CSA11_04805 [Chloroflexi bacterium]|nr:MAG: hypothetical protein CSA11_04805 [Chloroflexota bacterium]